jgi:hypothetical protein
MSKSPAAPLMVPMIPKKGEAAPAVSSIEERSPVAAPAPASVDPQLVSPRLLSRVQATIAVTVRLDEQRYERMKTWGTTSRRVTNQEIIVAALDGFFRLSDEEREAAIASVRR